MIWPPHSEFCEDCPHTPPATIEPASPPPAPEPVAPRGTPREVFIDRARGAKRDALVARLRVEGLGLDDVDGWSLDDWCQLAKRAGVRKPSATTVELVLATLRQAVAA